MIDTRTVAHDVLERLAESRRARLLAEAPRVNHELASRYVAGVTLDEALPLVADLVVAKRRLVSMSYLHPAPRNVNQARGIGRRYLDLLRRLRGPDLASGRRVDLSLHLSALGWGLAGTPPTDGRDLALGIADRIAEAAEEADTGLMLEVDAAAPIGAAKVRDVLGAWDALRRLHPRIGVVVPAALRTSLEICERLAADGARVRLIKGSPGGPDCATTRHEVDLAYVRCLRALFQGGAYTVVSTYDVRLLEIAAALAAHVGLEPTRYECQLPYGVRPERQAIIGDRGDQVRVYVPYGRDWYGYLLRHAAEEPTNLVGLARAVLAR